MARLIELLTVDESSVWVNPEHIISVRNVYDGKASNPDAEWMACAVQVSDRVIPINTVLPVTDIIRLMKEAE